MNNLSIGIGLVTLIFPLMVNAGQNDSVPTAYLPIHKNVLKFNPTPMLLLYPKNVTFSYERVLSQNQSISIELGYFGLPSILGDTLLDLVAVTSQQKWGLNASLEYRFYLTKLNTRAIPAGLYIGPYLASYNYSTRNDLSVINSAPESTGTIKSSYHALNLGFEVGYQFVFWKRITLDLIMFGPSLSYSWGKNEITSNLTDEQKELLSEELYNKVNEQYPVFKHNIPISKDFQNDGSFSLMDIGFRFIIQIGVHF